MKENTQYWNQLISKGIRLLQEQNNDAAAAVLEQATFDVEHSYHDSWRWGTDYWALIFYLKHADFAALGEGKEQLEKDIMSALVTLQKGSKDLLSTVSIRPLVEENTEQPEVLPLRKAVVDAEPFVREGTLKEYALLSNDKTFAFSAENPTGARGGGSRGGDCTKLSPTVTIHAGETVTLAEVDGSGLIQNMWFTGYVGHSFILRIYWDDQDYPSVEAPLSAFFGCAYDENFADRDGRYPVLNSAVMLVAPGRGYNCFFEMPFKKRCRITMENRSDKDEDLYYIITGCMRDLPDNIAYFHASYRQEHPAAKGRSYTIIDGIKGKGQFLGVTLATGMNGNNTCWVEGEAKMYIDDDEYPSINYTGTEDYFTGSYAFGNDIYIKQYQTFSGHYSGMYAIYGDNRENYNGQQRFLLYRFHVPDPIHFEESFRMTIDNLGWTGPRYDDYTSVAYWYQSLPSARLKDLPTDGEMCMR